MVFGDFDADGLDGLAILVARPPTVRARQVEPYVPSRLEEGHGLSMAADRGRGRRRDRGHRHRRYRDELGDRDRRRRRLSGSTSSSPIITASRRAPAGRRGRQPAPAGLALPGSATGGERRRLQGRPAPPRRTCPAGRPPRLDLADLATIGTVADVAPIVGENRAIARLGLERLRNAPRPGIAALLERARVAPAGRRPRHHRIRPRPAAERRRAGRRGARRPPGSCSLRMRPRRAGPRRRARGGQPRPARHHDDGRRRGAGDRRGRSATGRRPSSAARGRSASSGSSPPAWPRIAPDRPSSGRSSAMWSGRRAGATARSTSARPSRCCADLFMRHGGHAGAAGFEIPPTAGRRSSSGSRPSPRPPSRPIHGPCSGSTWPCPPSTSTTRCSANSPAWRRTARAIPEPLVAVLGLTVTRVRVAGDDHTSLTLRRDRDVLDGIAFGRADIAALVQEGDRIDVVARLTSRRFGGFESLQLEIRDAAPSGSHAEAGRHHRRRRPRPWSERDMTRMVRPRRVASTGPVRDRPARPTAVAPIAVGRSGWSSIGVMTINLLNGDLPLGPSGGPAVDPGTSGPTSDRGAVERRGRARRRRPSWARSCTPRAATSGSRRTRSVRQLTDARGDIDAVVVGRRRSGSSTSTTHDERGYWPVRGRQRPLRHRGPGSDARQGRRQRRHRSGCTTGYFEKGKLDLVVLDPPARPVTRRQRRSPS